MTCKLHRSQLQVNRTLICLLDYCRLGCNSHKFAIVFHTLTIEETHVCLHSLELAVRFD